MFGSSGVRGIVGKEIDPILAVKIGIASANLYKNVLVGNDPRTSSIAMKNALIAGLLFGGVEVYDAGLVSTPTLAYGARHHDAGIMITASHNPPEYNGIKIFNKDGSGLSIEKAKKIEDIIKKDKIKYVKWDEFSNLKYKDIIDEHIEAILRDIGEAKGEGKIIVDCSNGAASTITPYLFRKMGYKVITLNSQPDGFFPAHRPEPVDENLEQLKHFCKMQNSFGIAHDCDADRMVAVDKKGRVIQNEKLMILFAEYINAKKMVVPVDASMILDDYLDAKIIRTKVGDIFISEKLKEIKGDFGAEASGTWIFPSFSFCPDGIYAAAKFIKMAEEVDIMEKIYSLPQYPIIREAIKLDRQKIVGAMKKIEGEVEKLHFLDISYIDGLRIEFEDSWALIRASGTEPKIRITIEARKKERVKELRDEIMEIVRRCAK